MTQVDPPYFAPLTFGDDAERDAFMQQWFGKHLRSMDEPRLYLAYPYDVVRVLMLPTFHEPRLVRIDLDPTTTRIAAKQTDGRGGYGVGRLKIDKTIVAPCHLFNDAIALLNSIDFWNLPRLDDANVLDGTRYVIESRINGEYHVIERASPNTNERKLLAWINANAQELLPKRWITRR
ncbi:MAG: hypothetical protein JNK90_05125 [Planctomycetaceae bacterium]|nr:hypothetical protein [Planctomycetaceae bacterium]